jgi:hypothetical protein
MSTGKSSLNIKNPEVYDLARKVSQREGTTLTETVLIALREKLAKSHQVRDPRKEEARLQHFIDRISSLPERGHLTNDEILGYGPGGYPE